MSDKKLIMKKLLLYFVCLFVFSCESNTDKPSGQQIDEKEIPNTAISESKITLDTLLNTNKYLVLGKHFAKIKVIKESQVDDFPTFEILIGYRDDILIGENIEYDDLEMYRKYNPTTRFEDYSAGIYNGELKAPDFSSNPNSKRFITRIKKGCEDGINFAGHYTLITWGCGSPCQSGVLVDRKNGKIFDGYGTALGAEFRKDSKMIIRNIGALDTTTNLIRICSYCYVNHEVWTGTEFEEVE